MPLLTNCPPLIPWGILLPHPHGNQLHTRELEDMRRTDTIEAKSLVSYSLVSEPLPTEGVQIQETAGNLRKKSPSSLNIWQPIYKPTTPIENVSMRKYLPRYPIIKSSRQDRDCLPFGTKVLQFIPHTLNSQFLYIFIGINLYLWDIYYILPYVSIWG